MLGENHFTLHFKALLYDRHHPRGSSSGSGCPDEGGKKGRDGGSVGAGPEDADVTRELFLLCLALGGDYTPKEVDVHEAVLPAG